jgi:predicted nucleotide-binding protein (sugar kinase/HSP70/actin superfamily)
MLLTWPHFDYNNYLFQGLLQDLGREKDIVPPVRPTPAIIEQGSFYSEEDACSPFKFVLGSFIDSLERGANHLIIGDGTGTCRFSLYGPLVQLTLRNLGYDFTYSSFDYHKPLEFVKCFKNLSAGYNLLKTLAVLRKAWIKNRLLDDVKRLLTKYRAMETARGSSEDTAKELWERIMNTKRVSTLRTLQRKIPQIFAKQVDIDTSKDYLKFAILGEIYVVLVEEANYGIEKILNEMGVITETNVSLRKFTDVGYKLNPFKQLPQKRASKLAAQTYLQHYCGGCGQENVGNMLKYHERGFDGAFHVAPLPCLPEISGAYILEQLSRELDFPILPIFADEYEYNAGFQTRIEAFVNTVRVWGKKQTATTREKTSVKASALAVKK